MAIKLLELQQPDDGDIESQKFNLFSEFQSPHPDATLPAPRGSPRTSPPLSSSAVPIIVTTQKDDVTRNQPPPTSLLPEAITSPPLSPPVHPIIATILKDSITSHLLKYPQPFLVLATSLTISVNQNPASKTVDGNYTVNENDTVLKYQSITIIMAGLLGLAVIASTVKEFQKEERPVFTAFAEMAGGLLILAAFIYPMSVVLWSHPTLWFIPMVIGAVIVMMYAYRLGTASGGDTEGASV